MGTLKELRDFFREKNLEKPKNEVLKKNKQKGLSKKTDCSENGEKLIDEVLKEIEFDIETPYKPPKSTTLHLDKLKEEHDKSRWQVNYIISLDGEDVTFLFGKHKSHTAREVKKNDPNYLRWLVKQPFPKELVDVVNHILRS